MGNAAMDDRIGVGSADIDAERLHEPHAVGPLDRGEAEALCDVRLSRLDALFHEPVSKLCSKTRERDQIELNPRSTLMEAGVPPSSPRPRASFSGTCSCLSMIFSENRFPLFRILL